MNLENKCVLVTGADGFIGSHLVERLMKKNARIKALAYYNSFNSWGWLESIDGLDDIEVVSGDIRDSHFCEHITVRRNIGIWNGNQGRQMKCNIDT